MTINGIWKYVYTNTNPGSPYSQPEPARFQPKCSCTHSVSTPFSPIVARNANASATPPN
jgi:hypothetical protein